MVKPKGAPEDPYCPFRERVNKLFDAIVCEVTTLGGLLYDEDYGDPNHFSVGVKVGQFKTIVRDAFREMVRGCVEVLQADRLPCDDEPCDCDHEYRDCLVDAVLQRFEMEAS